MTFRKEHEKCEFDVHEVYGIDVLVSTGDGKVCTQNIRKAVHAKPRPLQVNVRQKLYATGRNFGFTCHNDR